MKDKINVAELLKGCPKGMELDCTMLEGLEFDCIVDNDYFPIRCRIKNSNDGYNFYNFTKYGYWNDDYKAKCVIFPKGMTTWEGFVPPSQFKDGDIIKDSFRTCIFKREGRIEGTVDYYCGISSICNHFSVKDNKCRPDGHYGVIVNYRLATEEEKQKLFDAIKANGYRWNAETKTLEKLIEPKFKVGDWIVTPSNKVLQITSIEGTRYRFNNESHYWEIYYCDKECHLWTMQDAKDGDVLVCDNGNNKTIYLFKEQRGLSNKE